MNSLIERISHFFADNQSLSTLILAAALVFGVGSFLLMPKQYNPEIIRPAFVVSFAYKGATTAQTEKRVVYELIEKIQVIPGVDDIYTTVTDGAAITTTVLFAVGQDKVVAKTSLLTQIESHSHLASGAVSGVQIQEINPETIPIMQIVLSAETQSVFALREQAQYLRQRLLAVPGVSEVVVIGGGVPAVVVDIDPFALASVSVSITDVEVALRAAGSRHTAAGFESESGVVRTVLASPVATPSELMQLPLGATVKLGDVAVVYEGVSPKRSYTLHTTRAEATAEVVMLGISKQEGTSAPVVAKAVNQALVAAVEQLTPAVTYTIVADDGQVASNEIFGLTKNLVASIVIVSIVLFLFLSPRAALVVLITIPLTFLLVLGIGFLAGETVNRITLFALILSLGLLVDSSIVVVDIIYEHLKRASAQGRVVSLPLVAAGAVREVGGGLVISTLTSVVVFLPMLYISGMMGPYMGPIAFFVPVALIVSLVVAVMLAPFIAISILKTEEKIWPINQWAVRVVEHITARYVRVLRVLVSRAHVRRRLLWSAGGALALAFVLPMVGLVHFQMLPKADRDQLYVYVDMPTDTAREATRTTTESITNLLLEHAEVKSVQSFVATGPVVDFNGLFKGASTRTSSEQATLRVNLTPATKRRVSSTDITNELRARVALAMGDDNATVRFMEEPPGPPVTATFEVKVFVGDEEERVALTQSLRATVATITGVVDIDDTTEQNTGQVVYQIDTVAVANQGISLPEITTWYQVATGLYQVTEVLAGTAPERMPLLLSVPYAYRSQPDHFLTIPISGIQDASVSLASVLVRTYEPRASARRYEGVESFAAVTAEVEDRSIVYVMIEVIRTLLRDGVGEYEVTSWGLFGMTLSTSDGETAELRWGGEWEMTLENFRDLGLAMMVALALVYGILVAQYRSFSTPGLILVTVPLGLIGILFGFLVLDQGFGIYLTATALIGFIALIGIVVNNAIIYLEYVSQAVQEGTSFPDALVAAGALRLRPIMLTSLTTVLGSLTIASDPVWSGLAWAIIFGLSLSTFLTLVILPSFLMAVQSPTQRE